MGSRYQEYADKLGYEKFTDPQIAVFDYWENDIQNDLPNPDRMCVYYPTGKGKTAIMLTSVLLRGHKHAVVVTPPSTQPKWQEDAEKLGMTITAISHAKFRMKDYKLDRGTPLIVDEFHMLGGQKGNGWKKLDRAAGGLKAPLIIGSATPEYNDAERVYCVAHVLDPMNHRGGYDGWLYEHCITEPNRFAVLPTVIGLRDFKDAEEFLASLPGVVYLPDDAPDIIQDVEIQSPVPSEFLVYGLDTTQPRLMASQMEARHRKRWLQIVDMHNRGHDLEVTIQDHVYEAMISRAKFDDEQILIYVNHSSIAEVLYDTMRHGGGVALVTGDTTAKNKEKIIQSFRDKEIHTLIGTATLGTGTDGLDKVCDTMFIIDDTDDNAARRQLVGRILTRGVGGSNDDKIAYRFVYED